MMEQILICLEQLTSGIHEEENVLLIEKFYEIFSKVKFISRDEDKYFREYGFPKLHSLFVSEVLKKDILYLYIIVNRNWDLLQKCVEYDKSVFKLDMKDPCSLFDYTMYYKRHWFSELLKSDDDLGKDLVSHDTYNKILILRLIKFSHLPEIDVASLKTLVNQINLEYLDEFWSYYIAEIKYIIRIVDFCESFFPECRKTEIFTFTSVNTMLETFSKFLDLEKLDCDKVMNQLSQDELHNAEWKSQKDTYFIFSILTEIINIIVPRKTSKVTGNITDLIANIKIKIMNIKDNSVQMELLENIFAIMFIKDSFIINDLEPSSDHFLCFEKEIRFILFLLRSVLEEIKLNNVYNKESKEYEKFQNLFRNVTDAMWRLDLIVNVKKQERCEKNLMQYMLAPPESMLQMCLKTNDFARAYQVIKIFELKDSKLACDIDYSEKLQELKSTLKTIFRIKSIQKQNPNIKVDNMEVNIHKTVEKFFKNNPPRVHEECETVLDDFSKEYDYLPHLKAKNELFMNIFDLAITLPTCHEDSETLLQLAFEYNTLNTGNSSYSTFSKRVLEVFNEIGTTNKLTVSQILSEPSFNLNIARYKEEQQFYNILIQLYDEFNTRLRSDASGVLNTKHPTHKLILSINKLCNDYVDWNTGTNDNVKYLAKLFNYLRAFSKILYIEQNTSDIVSKGKNTSYFELLHYNRAELMGKLLFEKNLDPSEFERYFSKLKLDYLYHVAGNCFPTVNLHTEENVTKDELYPENSLYVPSKAVIAYIQKRNWLLALILNEMYKVDGVDIGISQSRVVTFLNYMKLREIQNLKALFEENEIITALQNDISFQKVADYFNKRILKHEPLVSSIHSSHSSDSFETGEEIQEDALKSTNWKALIDIIDSVPEIQRRRNSDFVNLRDMVLVNIVQDAFEIEYYKYVRYIQDRDLRVNTILDNLKKWPGPFCVDVIKSELSRFDQITEDGTRTELKTWLNRVELCEKLVDILNIRSWSKIYELCLRNTEEVINKLLVTDRVQLLIDYLKLHPVNEDLLLKIDYHYFVKIFDSDAPLSLIKTLLDSFPYDHTVNVCRNLLKLLKKLNHLQFIADYLATIVSDSSLKNVQISLKILSAIAPSEQELQFFCLLYEPLSIIEILIMNTKLNQLTSVLDILKPELANAEADESMISLEKIDELLRCYAEKSLDFRVITQPNPRLLRTPECKLMQSLDSLNMGSDCKGFVMPEEVPAKEDWVQNHEVLECMCCQNVTFSMFNRRHHCRRCGRVVCYNCSHKRMIVPTYGNILVRACSDCFEQTHGEAVSEFNETTSIKSIFCDCWLLSDDPEHNKIVREEFSYEYAPSVSLCLSLLKFHSKNQEYTRFLLEQCDIMLKLIQPNQEPLQEIDYLLVIKMLKSLAVAAKMSTTECSAHYGTTLADRILSQSELIGLLAERGCLNLLPVTGHNQSPYIDAAVLRRLRDKLLEREMWNLALEVSTKAGMDNTGVFVAWGKSCLKAGSLLMAREKFGRCFDKSSHYDSMSDFTQSEADDSSDTLVRSKTKSIRSTTVSLPDTTGSKPAKNPSLLNEIIFILESKTESIDSSLLQNIEIQRLSCLTTSMNQSFTLASHPDAAVCIFNKLKRLKNISAGNYVTEKNTKAHFSINKTNRPSVDRVFYEECVYYLSKYGTYVSLLEFFVKHGDLERALNYITERKLSTDVFIEVYMRCLKEGIVDILHAHMSKIDSTLDVWKDYLTQICCHLEKKNLLNSLYQLQLFIGDYIRAAITCIRFYEDSITNFTDLSNNSSYLEKAEEHLKQILEQEQWVEVASVKSSTSKEGFEEKGLANPSLVMKMKHKDIDKHINGIALQIEVTKFLADCESLDIKPMLVLGQILNHADPVAQKDKKIKIPTLFGSAVDKLNLAVLSILCGKNIEDGFNVALKIIKEFKLKPLKVFNESGKQLAKMERFNDIAELVSCIKTNGTNDKFVTEACDEMLSLAIATLTKAHITGTKIEDLIKLISDRASKISAYIEAKQLKTAYFLAVKYKRMSDIRRILREAELLNQPNIKSLCQKVLQNHSHSPVHTKD